MSITFERNLCCNFDETISREWLITNGLGGYAAGTVAGTLTRQQQGLLVAALDEESSPQLLLAKIDEEALFDQKTYYLGTNEYQDGTLNPAGFVHLESFRLEEGFPVFTYRLGGIDGMMLEKRIWMPRGQNTTCIQYRVLRVTSPQQRAGETSYWSSSARSGLHHFARPYNQASLENAQSALYLTLLPLVAYRPYNQPQYGHHDWQFQVQSLPPQESASQETESQPVLPAGSAGCTIRAHDGAHPYHLLAIGHSQSQTQFLPTGVWYWRFRHRHDQAAGQPGTSDLYLPGVIRTRLWPDENVSLTIVVSAEDLDQLPLTQKQLRQSYEYALDYQRGLWQGSRYFGEGGGSIQTHPVLPLPENRSTVIKNEEFPDLLYQAGDRLLNERFVHYPPHGEESGFFHRTPERIPTITSGYYLCGESVRETLIALPGLTLATHRYSEARRILRSIARHFKQGLLPDRLPASPRPKPGNDEYNNVDCALWYFNALDKYLTATHDYEFLEEVYPHLSDCITWYTRGTLHGIGVDPADGLLRTGESERPLTWMNAELHGVPVTPRMGKPVEVNALWYNALSLMYEWSQLLNQRGISSSHARQYSLQAEACWRGFHQRFWYHEGSYLYDLIDGPDGNDPALRPNQLLAIALHHSVLDEGKRAGVIKAVTRQLLTPYGLRTLAPDHPAYRGELAEHLIARQEALHQGSVWPWLIGTYIDALFKGQRSSGGNETRNSNQPSYKEGVWSKALHILEPFRQHMLEDMLGSIGSVYNGNAPHQGGNDSQLTSAISIAELLRIYKMLADMGIRSSSEILSA